MNFAPFTIQNPGTPPENIRPPTGIGQPVPPQDEPGDFHHARQPRRCLRAPYTRTAGVLPDLAHLVRMRPAK